MGLVCCTDQKEPYDMPCTKSKELEPKWHKVDFNRQKGKKVMVKNMEDSKENPRTIYQINIMDSAMIKLQGQY